MKLSLYTIETEYLQLAELILAAGGEVDEETEKALQLNKENLETKAVNYGFICKQLEAETSIIDGEMARLSNLKKARDKTITKLKDALSVAMKVYEVDKIESPLMKISFRKSESTEIDNVDLIDKKYMVVKTTSAPDKKMISDAIKAGEIVTGARIQQNSNLQIK